MSSWVSGGRRQVWSGVGLVVSCLVVGVAHAQDEEGGSNEAPNDGALVRALREGEFWLDFRYRFEFFDQSGISRNAYASTLRSVLGYESAPFHNASVLLEFESVSNIGNDLYNSGRNGVVERPAITEPDGSSVNQAFLRYRPIDAVELRVGRQDIRFDDQRFIGASPWRQKWRTHDAVSLLVEPVDDLEIHYSYVDSTNQPNRLDVEQDTHFLNARYLWEGVGNVVTYGYWIDQPDAVMRSNFTGGVILEGEQPLEDDLAVTYRGEFAHQVDFGDNPVDQDATYFRIDLGARVGETRVVVKFESIEGEGTPGSAVQFPFGTNHRPNGWTDVFLAATPDTGLEDLRFFAQLPLARKVHVDLAFHDFRATHGSAHYGSELNAFVHWHPDDAWTLSVGVGTYFAADFAEDRTRAWVIGRLVL